MLDPALDKLAGQRVSISYYDEVAINKAYDCADRCPQRCQNHGYARRVRGRCRCFCPPFIGENFVGDIQFCSGSEKRIFILATKLLSLLQSSEEGNILLCGEVIRCLSTHNNVRNPCIMF